MVREFSAGGVVIREFGGSWHVAVIEPNRENSTSITAVGNETKRARKPVLALPKGMVDKGERPEQTALREVREETGVEAELVGKLGDIKYVYQRTWGDGERVFKVVSFYLFRYLSGELGNITDAMKIEVRRAEWMPLETAAKKLSYKGEREMAAKAIGLLAAGGEGLP